MSSEIPTFPPPPRRSLPLAVIVAVSIVSGFGGAFLLFWFFPEVRQTRIPPGTQSVIVQGPGKVVVEESTRLRELREQNKRVVAGIYRSDAGLKIGDTMIYPESRLLGAAVLLTTDGWFAATTAVSVKVGDILLVEGRSYRIEKLMTDTASPYVMGKIAGGERLTPLTFSDTEDRHAGMTLWTLGANGETAKTVLLSDKVQLNLNTSDDSPVITSSDKLSLALALETQQRFPAATPVFDLGGQLTGLIFSLSDGRGVVLPSDVLQSFMINVLKFGTPRRPFLGVSYVFDAYPAGENNEPTAIIYNDQTDKGVVPKSPAARAGLRTGDQLVSVNGAPLDSISSFFVLVQQYNPGDNISIEYRRQSKQHETTVTLGELPVKK